MKPKKQACNLTYRQLETSTQGSIGKHAREKQASTTRTQTSKHAKNATIEKANTLGGKQASSQGNKQANMQCIKHACKHAGSGKPRKRTCLYVTSVLVEKNRKRKFGYFVEKKTSLY